MTKILLIRHGESEANRHDIFAGHINPDLLERGIMQAKLTAKYIVENFRVDKIYSSDLQRAFKTARELASLLGMEVIPEPGMREIRGGKWEGEVFAELATKYAEDFSKWIHDVENARCTDGESLKELNSRIMSTLTRIAKENEGKTVAVATHATPIKIIMSNIKTGGFVEMNSVPWVSNASVTVVEYNNGDWKIQAESLDSHLSEIKTVLPELI